MIGDAQDVYLTSGHFDDEEHIELFERDGVDRKEISRQYSVGLCPKEL